LGYLDFLGKAGDYWDGRLKAAKEQFDRSFTEDLPNAFHQWWGGVATLAHVPFNEDADFAKGARLWLDGAVGMGASVLGGTFGAAFQGPGLHEAAFMLDKAYRYGIARPLSTAYLRAGRAALAGEKAHKEGGDYQIGFWKDYLNFGTWLDTDPGSAWADSENVTPGQAMVWGIGGLIGATRPGDPNDPLAWLKSHDPRSVSGQQKFNSPNAEFLTKYASGGLDTLFIVGADPAYASSKLIYAGKSRYFDNIATESYIRRGGVEKEIDGKRYRKFYDFAKRARSPEELRVRTMPHGVWGGQVSTILWSAARMGDDMFRDAYVVARGLDGAWDGVGLGAWDRLTQQAPRIASDFSRLFANWNIGEDALMLTKGVRKDAIQSLILNDVDAFVSGMLSRQGIWGEFPGKLMGQKQPKLSRASALRAGVHTWAMDMAPVMVGRPMAKTVQNLMPSQGYTPFLDGDDATAIALRQFRANLERSGMLTERVEHWVSQWGAKGTREGRTEVYHRAEDEAIRSVGERLGLDRATIDEALKDIGRFREGSRKIMAQGRVYISDFASRAGARNVAAGRVFESKEIRDLNKGLTPDERRGEFGDAFMALPDGDGRLNMVPIPHTGNRPSQAAALDKPLLLSQTEQWIPTIDFRSLEGQLKWWKMAHRPRRNPGEPRTVGEFAGDTTLKFISKTHEAWDAFITGSDFANMVWKASALLRPAQMPRNLADDVLRRYLIFGKLPLIMGSMKGTRRVFQNTGRRLKLAHEEYSDRRATRRAGRGTVAQATADVEELAPMNLKPGEQVASFYEDLDIGDVWQAGLISIGDYIHTLKWMLGTGDPQQLARVPDQLRDALMARELKVEHPYSTDRTDTAFGRGITDHTSATAEGLFATGKAPASKKTPSEKYYDRALVRRIVEFHFGDQPTQWLDDLRMKGYHSKQFRMLDPETGEYFPSGQMVDEATGEYFMPEDRIDPKTGQRRRGRARRGEKIHDPLDPRRPEHEIDARLSWIHTVIAQHQQRRARAPGSGRDDGESRGDVLIDSDSGGFNAYRPGQIVVNPFSGDIPRDVDLTADFTIRKHLVIDIKAQVRGGKQTGLPTPATPTKVIADFIADNIDEFMRPDTLLSMSVMPDGNIRIGIARAKPEAAAKAPIKVGFTRRLRNFKFKDIVDAGHEKVRVTLSNGETITWNAAFGSPEGEAFQHRVSALGGQGTAHYLSGDFNLSRMQDQMGGWGILDPDQRGYARSWERAVNAQLATDPVARMFLEGKTDSDVYTWIESTAEGTKYLHRMHYFGVNYIDHVRQIEAMVNDYTAASPERMGTKAMQRLRQAILEQKATRDMLDAVEPRRGAQPQVHGASLQYLLGKGAIFSMISRGVDNAQKLIADLPTDKASRFPFFAEAYRRHLTMLTRIADRRTDLLVTDGPTPTTGAAAKLADSDIVSVKFMDNLERQARDLALYETKYRLYDVAQINDLARLSRFVVPFSSAIMDSYIKYGRMIRDNPGVVLQGLYYWEMFERNESVQDENGYVMKYDDSGKERWYAVDPATGERAEVAAEKVGQHRYVQFRFPSDILNTTKYYGVNTEPVFAVNKKSFNVFLDLPSTGPVVAIPANEFALDNPEFGEKEFVRRFILPFGPAANPDSALAPVIQGDLKRIAVPSNIRSIWDRFTEEDGQTAEGHAKAIFQAELIAYGRGERDKPPTFQEVRERAAMLRNLRILATWVSPASFQVASPYQPYIDSYRQLLAENPEQAAEQFMARHGEEFYALQMTVSRNVAGVRATIGNHKAAQQKRDLIAAYPDLAGLIAGNEGGTFSKSVYEAQKLMALRPGSSRRFREMMSLEESVDAVERDRVWTDYTKLMDIIDAEMVDRGLATLRGAQAADLVEMRDAFIESNKYWEDPATGQRVFSPWYNDFTSVDHAQMEKRIANLWAIVQDKDLQKRDDIRGLIDYLHEREDMQRRMGLSGFQTLNSVKASPLREQWRARVFNLRERNPAFAQVHARWLSRDDELQLSREGVAA
jgi:hypothetical protein